MLSFFHHLLLWLLIVLRIVYVCQDSIYSLCLFLWSFCDTNCKPSLCFDELCLHTSLVQPIVVLRIRKLIDDGLERYATQGITLRFTLFTRSIVCTTQCKMCHRNEAMRERASAALQEKYTWYNHYTRLLQRNTNNIASDSVDWCCAPCQVLGGWKSTSGKDPLIKRLTCVIKARCKVS